MFILSKALLFLLNPLVWVVFLSIYGLVSRRRWLIYGAVVVLYLFSLSYPIDRLLADWEFSPRPLPPAFVTSGNTAKAKTTPRVAIVLAGMLPGQLVGKNSHTKLDRKPIDMGDSSERLFVALQLFQTGHIDHIIISGGSGLVFNEQFSESKILAQLAADLGIPQSALTVEATSRNTYENAKNTAKIITERFSSSPLLLITSSFHMERAYRAFRKQNIFPDVYPVDFRTPLYIRGEGGLYKESDSFLTKIAKVLANLEPKAEALSKWQMFLKEVLGVLSYTAFGYI